MMALILALGTISPPHVSRSHSVGVVYEFFKRTTIPGVVNIFGASDKSDALQDNWLKNDPPIGIEIR